MTFGKKLLLLFIVVLFIYILYNLLKSREEIIRIAEQKQPLTEGFSMENLREGLSEEDTDYKSAKAEVDTIAINEKEFPSGILPLSNNLLDMNINQFCIKGSSNSAFSGGYISDIMVSYVLSRGCRYLDFEIYNSDSGIPCVGYSSDPSATSSEILNANVVSLLDLLKSTLSSAFISNYGSNYFTPNPGDPLFINFRLKTGTESQQHLYESVQEVFKTLYNTGYSQYFFIGPNGDNYINSDTKIEQIMGKIIIIFENSSISPNDYPLSNTQSPDSGNYYNAISNTKTIEKSFYNQINPSNYKAHPPKSKTATTVTLDSESLLSVVFPDNNKKTQTNPNIFSSIENYGNHITLYQYYVSDAQLIAYEGIFKAYGSSFVPMSYCLNYINMYATSDDLKPIQIVAPLLFSK